jgi:hypothetical protein
MKFQSFSILSTLLILATAVQSAPVWGLPSLLEAIERVAPSGAAQTIEKAGSSVAAKSEVEFMIPEKITVPGSLRNRASAPLSQHQLPAVIPDPPAPKVLAGRFEQVPFVNPVDGEILGSETVPVWREIVKQKHT